MIEMPVSIYFTAEWWDRHYHERSPRPAVPSQGALEEMYLGRRRFLFEEFGSFGIGDERPAVDAGQIATVIRYGIDFVPALLGTTFDFADAWGFYPHFRTLDEIRDLKPVDIRSHPEGEWILKEKERLARLYGGASHCMDVVSVTNNAFRIIGEDFYAGLIGDPSGVEALFETIIQTMHWLYDFLVEHFGSMDPSPIGNCNVSLMGPALYERHVLPFDARQAAFAPSGRAALHHCDVRVDDFIASYAKLPVASMQTAIASDIGRSKHEMAGSAFSALVSPGYLREDLTGFETVLRNAADAGVDDLAMWNIDTTSDPDCLRRTFSLIESVAREHGRVARFDARPLCWEEIEWAHARYQSA